MKTIHTKFLPYLLFFTTLLLVSCGGGGSSGSGSSGSSGESPAVQFKITCTTPFNGEMLNMAPGIVMLNGSIDHVGEVSKLTVNGVNVAVQNSGDFTAPVDAVWGVNFVDVMALDMAGRASGHSCAFLLSNDWAPDTEMLSSAISFSTKQGAIDDNNRSDLDSFADMLQAVINSNVLRDNLNATLTAANPLLPDTCYQYIRVPFSPDICVLSSKVTYLGLSIPGPNSTQSTLVNGGLNSQQTIPNLAISIRVTGQVSGVPYDTTAWTTFASIATTMTFDTTLAQGKPRVSLRPGSVSTSVGTINTNLSGLDGTVINNVTSLLNGTVRALVSDSITNFLTANCTGLLDGVFGGLDVNNLPRTFDVPHLGGGAPITVNFATGFSSLNTSSTRILTTMSTRFDSAPVDARITLGAPIPPGNRLLDVTTTQPTAAATAMHVGVINQALHALWRGGYFDATNIDNASIAPLPSGATINISARMPPTAVLRNDGRIELSLGATDLHLVYPSLIGDPVDSSLGGRVSCVIRLQADDLMLENCTVDERHMSSARAFSSQVQSELDLLSSEVLDYVLPVVANDTLPVLPLPGFKLPASVATYGLPAGNELGLLNPVLSSQGDHIVIKGTFGIR